jgi:hypothetical protein
MGMRGTSQALFFPPFVAFLVLCFACGRVAPAEHCRPRNAAFDWRP